jgi:hypothetical protein
MNDETPSSDEMLGQEAINAEEERVAKEEMALAQEEEVTRETDPEDDGDDDYGLDDVAPPENIEKPVYDELPPPEQDF